MEYIVSGRRGRVYTDLFERAIAAGPFTGISSAVAYATVGGVKLLEETLREGLGETWNVMNKKWLVGIDWCRTDPPALDRLRALNNSTVRVPDGDRIVARTGCTPTQTYHPKLFMLTSPRRTAIICGSGNLSRNALSRGCEVGGLLTLNSPLNAGNLPHSEARPILQWFRTEWQRADRYDVIAARYEAACRDRVRRRAIVPTDDDAKPIVAAPGGGGRALTEEQIHELRTFKNFWIDAGALGANLGAGVPGSQLDMKRYTRAFFGAEIEDIPPQTEIDQITLVWNGVPHADRTLKYGDNHMDKLNVPPSGDRGRQFYRNKTLLFTRRFDGGFNFDAGSAARRQEWRQTSRRSGVIHRLSATREWGLF